MESDSQLKNLDTNIDETPEKMQPHCLFAVHGSNKPSYLTKDDTECSLVQCLQLTTLGNFFFSCKKIKIY